MKMYFKNWIFALAGALAMTACSNEMEEQLAENGKNGQNVKFSIGVENLSRTAIADGTLVTSFEPNDEIGIFAYDGEKLVSSNVKYTYNGSEWTSENAIAAQDGVKLSYYAYYPYDASVTDPASIKDTVSADQTAGFGKNDMLSARNTEAAAGATNISLNFEHAMAMVQVSLKEGTTSDANATVTLQSILPVTSVNAKDGSVIAASGASVGVAMKKAAESLTYRAVVPEQTIKAGSKLLTIVAGGKTFDVTFNADVKYERGKFLQITVNKLNALPDGAEVTIGGKLINGWTPGENPEGGETEEVPLIQPFGDNLALVITDTQTFGEESWFQLKQHEKNTPGTFALESGSETLWEKVAKLTYTSVWDPTANDGKGKAVNNSWYVAAIGYNHVEPIYVEEGNSVYKVTLQIKSNKNELGKISPLVFTCKSKNLTDEHYKWSFAASTNPTSFNKETGATTVSVTPSNSDAWQEYIFYIDFSLISSTTGSIPGNNAQNPAKFESSSDADIESGFDLRIYTNSAATAAIQSVNASIYISDVTMEPYQE
ncbi:fimbrillin family protein [Phocaeicola plebeius]|uniref:fimbrillin family protein n=1 Tax=Phocaeicola plebeius TaxID=310297 RepID=UPI001959C722|nr:fimbrillin family protein [Phocaeicola plebeius]MBM6964244.1 fimbrillin family protein [Phocaeicola plebeius]